MGVVAAVAGHVLLLVGAAGPQGVFTGVVAGLATGTAHLGIRGPLRAKTDVRGVFCGPLFVCRAGAVAGDTAVTAATGQRAVDRIGNGVDRRVLVVAVEALALRLLCMGQHARGGQGKCAASQ